ncbi:MAG: prepilin-type N-terminal cleavage/methylation domain-containing protein [Trueperaceae bacterium]
MTRSGTRRNGFSLIEIMIASAITLMLFGMIAQFMGLQGRASSFQKATNEATDSARIALSLLSWDIQNAGYRVTVTDDPADMLGLRAIENGNADGFVIRYLDESLATPASQRISYSLGDEPRSLKRAQYPDTNATPPSEQPTVATVVALNAAYVTRSNQFVSPDPNTSSCPAGTEPVGSPVENCLVTWKNQPTAERLVRSVDLEILARSSSRVPGYQDKKGTYTFSDGSTYTTEPGFVYHYAEQTVVAPNLGR